VLPAARVADFDLWRNIMREFSEELLGNSEHGGDGQPVDYTAEPFRTLDAARAHGQLRVWLLGFALDALTLWGEVLTVAVLDAPVHDRIFARLVDTNPEGAVVKTGRARPTAYLPFTQHAVTELLDSGRLAPAAAGCLYLAWQHRRTILEG
jgi:hypothetical protein